MIGHIIDYQYVPMDTAEAEPIAPDMLSYGSSALARSVTREIERNLLAAYDPSDVFAIMSIATLRVIKPRTTANRMSTHYNRCFICRDYPSAAMSRNSIGKLFQKIGMDGTRRKLFYQRRMSATAADHHIAIDGTLKQDTSTVNELSAFSYKARVRGCNDVSEFYAYDIERMEPICAEVFLGNSIDASSYPAFIYDNDIRRGIIVAGKSFPPSRIKSELLERPDLHFLTPIKRNDVRIVYNDMLAFDGVFEGINAHIVYKKKQIKGGRFLYAFKDVRKASNEERAYLANAKQKNTFSPEQYEKNKISLALLYSNPIRTCVLKLRIPVMRIAGFSNLYSKDTKAMSALATQENKAISP